MDVSGIRPFNHQWRVVRIWTALIVLFLFVCFLPGIVGLDGMDGGFAIITISGMIVVSGLITLAFYIPRARRLDQMLQHDNFLAAWLLSREDWEKYLAHDLSEDRSISYSTYLLITVISLVVGAILVIASGDFLFVIIFLGIIAFLSLPAFIFPVLRNRRKRLSPPLVMIGENAAYVGGSFSNWGSMGASLNASSLDLSVKPAILTLTVIYPTQTGMSEDQVRLPVPEEKLPIIPELLHKLGLSPEDLTTGFGESPSN